MSINKLLITVPLLAVALTACAPAPGGMVGPVGPKGDVGTPGPTGPTGADGAIATVVPLCPGYTNYPNVFVEVALCINNELYGVYSANDGFLTYLPPGVYTSNGIGSACNLTVKPNCVVE